MNLQSFEYVTCVAQEKSFTRAAARLHVTQQTLSAHIASVEAELGCRLFVRSQPLAVTQEGQAFLARAEAILQQVADLRREVAGPSRLCGGSLRVGIAYTRGRAVMPRAIARLSEAYPNVCVRLDEGTNEELLANLAAGREDAVIGVLPQGRADIDYVDFYEEHIVLLVARSLLAEKGIDADAIRDTLAQGDLTPLAACPFVMGGTGDITGGLGVALFEGAGIRPQVKVQSNNMETLLALAIQGTGACLCPQNLIDLAATPAQLRRIERFDLGPRSHYQIQFGLPKHGYRWGVTSAFIELAKKTVPGAAPGAAPAAPLP